MFDHLNKNQIAQTAIVQKFAFLNQKEEEVKIEIDPKQIGSDDLVGEEELERYQEVMNNIVGGEEHKTAYTLKLGFETKVHNM